MIGYNTHFVAAATDQEYERIDHRWDRVAILQELIEGGSKKRQDRFAYLRVCVQLQNNLNILCYTTLSVHTTGTYIFVFLSS